ncbi:hypothetical protein D9M68_249840 [compost metagenome]
MRVEQHADDIGAAGLQALGGAVGRVADLIGDLAHPLAGIERNLRRIGKRAGYGGDRKAGDFRDRAKGRLAALGGGATVFAMGGLGGIGQCKSS